MATLPPNLVASRLLNAARVAQAADDADVTGWVKSNEFIVVAQIDEAKGPWDAQYTLRWRDVSDAGAFVDLAAAGEIAWGTDTDLTNGDAVVIGEKACDNTPLGSSWQNGEEVEGAATCDSINLADECYTEIHFACDPASADDGHKYEFQLWDETNGAQIGVLLADITMEAPPPVLTLGDFIGWETGGLEEASAGTSGTPSVQGTTKRTGTYAVELEPGDAVDITASQVSSSGEAWVVGFAIRFSSLPTAGSFGFFRPHEDGTIVLQLRLLTNGDLVVLDSTAATIDTATNPFVANQWYYIEIYWEHDNAGDVAVYIDGVSKLSGTGDFYSDQAFNEIYGVYNFRNAADTAINIYFDDIYIYSGASGVSDFLGKNTEVLGAYQNTIEDATDQGTTLDQGTWADTGDTPVEEEATPAGYTTTTTADGHTICDEGTRAGPAGDAGGTIKGAKWVHRLKKTADTATTHQKRYGHNGDTAATTITPTTAYVNYFTVLESSDSKCPTNSEYFAQGFAKDGAEYLYSAEMWAQLLHVAPPPAGQPTNIRTWGVPTGSGYRSYGAGKWN